MKTYPWKLATARAQCTFVHSYIRTCRTFVRHFSVNLSAKHYLYPSMTSYCSVPGVRSCGRYDTVTVILSVSICWCASSLYRVTRYLHLLQVTAWKHLHDRVHVIRWAEQKPPPEHASVFTPTLILRSTRPNLLWNFAVE